MDSIDNEDILSNLSGKCKIIIGENIAASAEQDYETASMKDKLSETQQKL